jgi:hypothetical protein
MRLFYFHEEADTSVILCLQHAVYMGFKDAVVRTPVTDICVILLHYISTIDTSFSWTLELVKTAVLEFLHRQDFSNVQ